MIRYYLFCIGWLWRHRYWMACRQKMKAMDKAWQEHERRRRRR